MRPERRRSYRRGMRGLERDQSPSAASTAGEDTEEGPALRDAASLASRVEADDREATVARERLLAEPLPVLDPDSVVVRELQPDELVHGLRWSAILRAPGDDLALGYGGTLYLTSRRLIHVGQVTMNVQLKDIMETSLAAERLLITLRHGEGIALDVDRPRTFRTEIAAALRGVRA
jgi:hypothetical protein